VLYELTTLQNKIDVQLIYLRIIMQILLHSLMMQLITVQEEGLLLTWADAHSFYPAICIQSAEATERNKKYCITDLANLYCFVGFTNINLRTKENYSYQRTNVTTTFNRHLEHVYFHV
jgi:hypothetical protein